MPAVDLASCRELLAQRVRPEGEAKRRQGRDQPCDSFCHAAILTRRRQFFRAVANSYRTEIPSRRAALPPMILFLSAELSFETLLMNPTGSSTPMS